MYAYEVSFPVEDASGARFQLPALPFAPTQMNLPNACRHFEIVRRDLPDEHPVKERVNGRERNSLIFRGRQRGIFHEIGSDERTKPTRPDSDGSTDQIHGREVIVAVDAQVIPNN